MRNKHAGDCYRCGLTVQAGTGHFERHNGGWRVKHANYAGHGRVTCDMAAELAKEHTLRQHIEETRATGCVSG